VFGYKTAWRYGLAAFVIGLVFRLVWTKISAVTGAVTPDAALWLIAAMYSFFAFFLGHQAGHLFAIKCGQATLNPLFVTILLVYHWLFWPWLFLIWFGYKTGWWYGLAAFVIGNVFRLVWTKISQVTGAIKNAWAISLIGIPIVPVLLIFMVKFTLWSTETTSLLEPGSE
jgi:hypothetical protein